LLVGITVDKFKGIQPSMILRLLRWMGVNFVELTKSAFEDLPNVLTEIGTIKTGIHLPNLFDQGFDFSSVDRAPEINQIIEHINHNYHQLNIQYCLSHPPESQPDHHNSNKYFFENLKRLKPPIIIENIASLSRTQFEDFYHQAELKLDSQLIGKCFDAPHYFVRGDDPVAILKSNDQAIKSIHLSNCKKNKDAHLPFCADGDLPIDSILATLQEINYRGIINLELLPRSLMDVNNIIHSYLKVIKVFDKPKYYHARMKLIIFAPLIRKTMRHSFSKKANIQPQILTNEHE